MDASCVRVAKVSGKGRGLVATRMIAGGEVVLQDSPAVLVMDEHAKSYTCSHCFRMANTGSTSGASSGVEEEGLGAGSEEEVSFLDLGEPFSIQCERCFEVWFCSRECKERAASASHPRLVCQALSKLERSELSSEQKNQARFLVAALSARDAGTLTTNASLEMHDSCSSDGRGKTVEGATLGSLLESLLLLDGSSAALDRGSANMFNFLSDALDADGKSSEALGQELVAQLLCKDQRNSYGIMAPNGPDGERRLRGSGTYLKAVLINHDCLPNVARFDYFDRPGSNNTDVFIRALHDIPAETEICQSYFPISWPYELRQERLLEEYGFSCVCQRCQTEEAWPDKEEDGESEDGDEDEGTASGRTGLEVIGTALYKGKEKVLEEGPTTNDKHKTRQDVEKDDPDVQSEVGATSGSQSDDADDFEHAFFFVKYLCPKEECGGTMAPLEGRWTGNRPGEGEYLNADAMECNACGMIRTNGEFELELASVDNGSAAELQ